MKILLIFPWNLALQALSRCSWIYILALVFTFTAATATYGQGLPVSRPQDVGLSPTALARITPAMQAYLDSGKYAGAVLVIARHGKIGYSQAIGYMNLKNKVPMRKDAVFRIASMTKPIIAAAIMKLVDKGEVSLGDPVAKFIPAFASLRLNSSSSEPEKSSKPPQRPMTVEDLLTHTSGLMGVVTAASSMAVANLRKSEQTLAEFADTIVKLPLTSSVGEKWDYSSFGYDVLGRIIEVASGQSLDQYLNKEIFSPIGMRETSFHVMPIMEGRIPEVYSHEKDGTLRHEEGFLATNYLPTNRFLSGGGGLLSTPTDYLRFAQMLLNAGQLDGKRILSRVSVTTMMRNHLSPSLTPLFTPLFDHTGYGFGLGGAVLVNSALSGEPGNIGIYRWAGSVSTFFWIDPKTNLIAMLFTQSTTGGYEMERDFQKLVYAAVLP